MVNDLTAATVMIATHNRRDELRLTLASLREQDWPAFEIIVVDDSSRDGTAEMVSSEFPEVQLVTFSTNRGSVAARNEILRRAKGEVIFGLDDDSRFIEPDAIRRVLERMESEPDLGIVAFQPIGPEHPERMTPEGRLKGEWHCSSFAACGVAIRRAMLAETGEFPEYFFHAYEEPDLVLRAWDHGYRVLQWNEIVVYHAFTPMGRNEQRTHRRHARNEACCTVMRYPILLVFPVLLGKLASQFRYACRRGLSWVVREPLIWWDVLRRIPMALRHRAPVKTAAVKTVMALNRRRVTDPVEARALGMQSWFEVFRR